MYPLLHLSIAPSVSPSTRSPTTEPTRSPTSNLLCQHQASKDWTYDDNTCNLSVENCCGSIVWLGSEDGKLNT